MSKRKTKGIIILAAFALLLGAALFFFFYFRIPAPKTDTEIDVWYVSDSTLWRSFAASVSKYNETEGAENGITVGIKNFSDGETMFNAVSTAVEANTELPDIVICDPDFAAAMDGMNILADIKKLTQTIGFGSISRDYIENTKLDGKQLLVPLASSVSVFIENTELMSPSDEAMTLEQLCARSGEYYKENSEPMFAIADYAMFFRNASMQLGGAFDGVSPHDTDDKTNKYIYRQLATAAYERGCCAADGDLARLVAEGKLPCAVLSSEEVMKYSFMMDEDELSFGEYPIMFGGEAVFDERIYGASVLSSDTNSFRASAQFLKWFASKDVNAEFVGSSGCICASGYMPDCDGGEIYSKLCDEITAMKQEGKLISCKPDAEYCVRSYSFNKTLNTIMSSLN